MLEAYIDDSNLGSGPTAVLGGWVAPAPVWAALSDEWKAVMAMRPSIQYFKYSEAYSFQGEFTGFSEESRDEKVKFLVAVLARHKPVALVNAIPHKLHKHVFGKNVDKTLRQPYWLLVYGIVTMLARHMMDHGKLEPVEFIFDYQDGQMAPVIASWRRLLEIVPPEVAAMLENPPNFQRSRNVVALQTADLSVGWSREQANAVWLDQEIRPVPWGKTGDNLQVLSRYWTAELIEELAKLTRKR